MAHPNGLTMTLEMQDRLTERREREERVRRNLRNAWYETAMDYQALRDKRLYRDEGEGLRGWMTWADYCQNEWGRTFQSIDIQIQRAVQLSEITKIFVIPDDHMPTSTSHVTALAKLETPKQRAEVWQRVIDSTGGHGITATVVDAEVVRYKAELAKTYITLAEWQELSSDDRNRALMRRGNKTFNETNENIEWAAWSWNPVTGCEHGCPYCYALDIANRFYPHKFEPTFHPDRLTAPRNTTIGRPRWAGDGGYNGVFVCSMADLFGEWVPQEWIDAVLSSVRQSPEWKFIFLTKNPSRLIGYEFPVNAWVGTTVDEQARIAPAENAFAQFDASKKFLSCEPLLEDLTFSNIGIFDWVIAGGCSKTAGHPEVQPDWAWVESLLWQTRKAGRLIYWKTNLAVRPREYPKD